MRKAFPECGSAPTADEMEGKQLDDGATIIDAGTGEIIEVFLPQDTFNTHSEKWKKSVSSGKKTAQAVINWVNSQGNGKLTDAMVAEINACTPVAKEEVKPEPVVTVEGAAIDPMDIPWEN